MPRVPVMDPGIASSGITPSARFDAPRAVNTAAEQSMRAGQALDAAADLAGKVERDAKALIDRPIFEDAVTRAMSIQMELESGDAGFVHAKGIDALQRNSGMPLPAEYDEAYASRLQEIRDGLPNEAVKSAFDRQMPAMRRTLMIRANDHMVKQQDAYNISVQQGKAEVGGRLVVERFDDPEQWAMGRAGVADAVRALNPGMDKDAVEGEVRKAMTPLHKQVISRMTEAGKVTAARDYFARPEVQAEMTDEAKTLVSGVLTVAGVEAEGLSAAESAYAKFGPDKPKEADDWLISTLKASPKALNEARRQLASKVSAYEDGQKVLISRALNHALTSGNYSFSSIPAEVKGALSESGELSLRQSLDSARERVDSRRSAALSRQDAEENRADRDKARSAARDARKLYIDLSENPEALKAENIETYMQTFFDSGRLDLYERLRKMQGGLRGEVPGDFEQVKAGRGIVDRYLKPYKKTKTNNPKFDGREVNDVRQDAYIWMEGKIDEWKAMNPGQTITHADMEKLAAEGFVRGDLTTDVGLIFDSKTTGFQFQADGRPFKPKNGPAPSSGKPETKKADPDSFTSISQIPAADRETLRRAAEVQGLTGKKAEAFMLNNYKTYLRSQ